MAGAILNPIITRLDPDTVAFILEHSEAKVLLTDRELSPTVEKALACVERKPIVIDIDDPLASGGIFLERRITKLFSKRGVRSSSGSGRRMSGTRSRSTTRRVPPAIPKAWSITTAALRF